MMSIFFSFSFGRPKVTTVRRIAVLKRNRLQFGIRRSETLTLPPIHPKVYWRLISSHPLRLTSLFWLLLLLVSIRRRFGGDSAEISNGKTAMGLDHGGSPDWLASALSYPCLVTPTTASTWVTSRLQFRHHQQHRWTGSNSRSLLHLQCEQQ